MRKGLEKLTEREQKLLDKCYLHYEIYDSDAERISFVLEDVSYNFHCKGKKKRSIVIIFIDCHQHRVETPMIIFFSKLNELFSNLSFELMFKNSDESK